MNKGICALCGKDEILQPHESPAKSLLPQNLKEKATIYYICDECHHKYGIGSLELLAIKQLKKKGKPFITTFNNFSEGRDNLNKGLIKVPDLKDRFLINVGSETQGHLIVPSSGTEWQLLSRNFQTLHSWNHKTYGWGIDVNSEEELRKIQKGAPYQAIGSPNGYFYNVDIFMNKTSIFMDRDCGSFTSY